MKEIRWFSESEVEEKPRIVTFKNTNFLLFRLSLLKNLQISVVNLNKIILNGSREYYPNLWLFHELPLFFTQFSPKEANKAPKHKSLLKWKIKKRRQKNATHPQRNHEFIAADHLFCYDSTDYGFRIPEKEEKCQLLGLNKMSVLVVGGRNIHFEKIGVFWNVFIRSHSYHIFSKEIFILYRIFEIRDMRIPKFNK